MTVKGYVRYNQTADVYTKSVQVNDAGQKYYSFTFDSTIPVIAISPEDQFSAGAKVRTAPYQDFIPVLQLIVPGEYANVVITTSRISSIKDREGNVLETGPFEIITIQPKFGWNGKKHHLVASLRTVVEQS